MRYMITESGIGLSTICGILPRVRALTQSLIVPAAVGAPKSRASTSASKYVRVSSRNACPGWMVVRYQMEFARVNSTRGSRSRSRSITPR